MASPTEIAANLGRNPGATEAQIAELFQVTPQNVTLHLRSIFADGERAILDRVVLVDPQVTCAGELEVDQGVGGECRQHVVEHADAGAKPARDLPVSQVADDLVLADAIRDRFDEARTNSIARSIDAFVSAAEFSAALDAAYRAELMPRSTLKGEANLRNRPPTS